MQAYQKEFIEFAIAQGVLRFGEFTLKSGRVSPYFFNAGLFNSGGALAKLSRFYAAALEDSGVEYDVVFGPAYKGIPLAATMAVALADTSSASTSTTMEPLGQFSLMVASLLAILPMFFLLCRNSILPLNSG